MIFIRPPLHRSCTGLFAHRHYVGCIHLTLRTLSTSKANKNAAASGGYQSIGSFHSDNVEELIRIPKDQYTPPELPFAIEEDDTPTHFETGAPSSSSIPFANSHKYIPHYPHLDRQNWTFLNHGAFGLALNVGIRRSHSWRMFLESQPLRFFDRYLLNHLVHSTREMVDFVTKNEKAAARIREGAALIQNVTGGMNAVIAGHGRCHPNKFAFYYDIEYGSNKKMCQTYHGKQNAIAIPFEEDYLPLLQKVTNKASITSKNIAASEGDCNPKSADIFLRALDSTIHTMIQNGDDKSSVSGSLLILDHITSNTAIHVPISSIAKYAKEEYGMVVAVDGAHALLSLPLDMGSLLSTSCEGGESGGYVDIYLTNAHKWFSSPRGAAMLFCANPEIRETILAQPAVVSHGVDDGFLSRFMWDGCRDYSAQLSLPAILNYWNNAGVDTARDEMKRNLKEGVKRLIAHWHPDVVDSSSIEDHSVEAGLTLVPLDMHAPMLALVRLPNHISGGGRYVPSSIQWECKTSTDAKRVQDFLFSQNVEVPIKCVRGVLYARVSCHVYNTIEEFEHLAKVALKYGVS